MVRPTPRSNPASALQQAGVDDTPFRTATLELEEVRGASLIRLHMLSSESRLAFELPQTTGACLGEDPAALCLRPNEWLIFSETSPAPELVSQLESQSDPLRSSVLNVSDGLAVFRLSGPAVPWLLGKLSCLDFLAGCKHGTHCARTRMGHVAVTVHYHQLHGDQFVFDLIFDRSIAQYLWLLLTESASHADELAKTCGGAR